MRAALVFAPLVLAPACGFVSSGILGAGTTSGMGGSEPAPTSSTTVASSGQGPTSSASTSASSSATTTVSSSASSSSTTASSSSSTAASSSSGAPTDWTEQGYGYRVKIRFDDSSGTEDLTNFPVPVLLTSSVVDFTKIQPTGKDIRFTDAMGNELPYETERWNTAGSTVWVLVPLVQGGSSTDYIWLYYGNPSASDGQMPAGVWAKNYGAVYHLGDDLTQSAPQVADSTGQAPARGGTWHGASGAGTAAGHFGNGIQVKGGAYVDLAYVSDFAAASSSDARTIEAWFSSQGSTNGQGFVVSAEGCCRGWSFGVWDAANNTGAVNANMGIDGMCCGTGEDYSPIASSGASYAANWHQAVLVVDRPGGTLKLYVDGAPQQSTPLTGTQNGDGALFHIGADWNGGTPFTGLIDEVRVSTVARTAGWIGAQHRAMNPMSGFTNYGAIQAY